MDERNMIVSKDRRYVFIHCRKNAGSSIKSYLNRYLGPDDIQVGGWRDAIYFGGRYNRRIRSDLTSLRGGALFIKALTRRASRRKKLEFARMVNDVNKRYYKGITGAKSEHLTASELRSFLGADWDSYFKFCFVRNPFDRAVSDYKWRTRRCRDVTFLEFLKRLADPARPDPERVVPSPVSNWPLYTIDDQIAVDHVGRFERLHADFEEICGRIGVPFVPEELPFAKRGKLPEVDYRTWYGSEERRLAASLFEKELEAFGYEF